MSGVQLATALVILEIVLSRLRHPGTAFFILVSMAILMAGDGLRGRGRK